MTILSTILGVESGGGHNVTQGNIGDINNATGDLAQGYYQITGATWRDFGGAATGYNSALQAPYGTQLAVAQNIPVARWGPRTQAALMSAGYIPQGGETLGQMLARYGENPTATTPADGAGPGDATIAHPPTIDPATGIASDPLASMAMSPTGKAGTGQQVTLGIQQSLFGDIQSWITSIATGVWDAVWKSVGSTFANIQNWFLRAFVIVVGIVILAIGLIKVTGHDVTEIVGKTGVLAAA